MSATFWTVLARLADGAGIIGLIAAVLAWRQARSAAHAAEQARDALLLRNASDLLELSRQRAEQLSDLVRHQRFPEAAMRTLDLMPIVAELQHRAAAYLHAEAGSTLPMVQVQLTTIREMLVGRGEPLDDAARRKVVSAIHKRVIDPLQELGARAKARLDQETNGASR